MVGARTATALGGLVGSLAVSVLLWLYFETLLLFLFVPFVPFLFRGVGGGSEPQEPQFRECPECGFRTPNDEYEYCPRDGRRLRDSDRQP
jgi:hypothetical protein